MGNRAVITFSQFNSSPCIYLHWNGGRPSVEAFLQSAKDLGLKHINKDNQSEVFDKLAHLIAKYYFGCEVGDTVYRRNYANADCDNGDNGVYIISGDMQIKTRRYMSSCGEEINPGKRLEIYQQIVSRAPVFN